MWPECTFEEEYENYKNLLNAENEICYLAREGKFNMAFIHVKIRTDFVEGATELSAAYLEALYVKHDYQKLGVGSKMVSLAEEWARQKGCKYLFFNQSRLQTCQWI